MATAKIGDLVKVHYTGKLEDGTIFDSSDGRDPLSFHLGSNQVIPGFERTVLGMEPGESRTSSIPPTDAYGEFVDEMVLTVNRDQIPDNEQLELGMEIQIQGDGFVMPVRVVEMTPVQVQLDGNHPLAGETLIFTIQLVSIG
jgi:peptidylprolyl isomerase